MTIGPRAVLILTDDDGTRRELAALIESVSPAGTFTVANADTLRDLALSSRAAELRLEWTTHAAETLTRAFAGLSSRAEATAAAGRELARLIDRHARSPRSKGDRHRNRRHRWSMPT